MGSASGGSYLIGFLIAGAIAFWVYSDAKKRGMNAAGWAAGTFLLCIVFLPLYLIIRKPVVTGPVGMPVPPGYIPPPPPGAYTQPPPGTYTQPVPPLPPPAAAPAPPAGTAHFCTQCGQRYEGTMRFCPNCGAAQG
jgi:hypothetical protein